MRENKTPDVSGDTSETTTDFTFNERKWVLIGYALMGLSIPLIIALPISYLFTIWLKSKRLSHTAKENVKFMQLTFLWGVGLILIGVGTAYWTGYGLIMLGLTVFLVRLTWGTFKALRFQNPRDFSLLKLLKKSEENTSL